MSKFIQPGPNPNLNYLPFIAEKQILILFRTIYSLNM